MRAVELLCSGPQAAAAFADAHRRLAVFLAAEGKLADAAAHVYNKTDEKPGMMEDYFAAAAGW